MTRNCGLFRYWTISNVPLFLLAAPMISIITMSIFWVSSGSATNGRGLLQQGKRDNKLPHEEERPVADSILLNLAMSQSLLLLLTLTTAHVQIITRISSAYPVWMWYLAALARKEDSLWGENLVRFLVIYALIQGGLFATFLPPA
jgi:phosphatidylinositol glycan class V